MSTTTLREPWQNIADRAQHGVLNSIPNQWRLRSNTRVVAGDGSSALAIPAKCGILSARQLEITSLTASDLLRRILAGNLSAVEATEAFCLRAAVAHQLLHCLTEFFPKEALATAKALDEQFARTGKPIGPLDGMPMVRVLFSSLKFGQLFA